MSYESKIWDKTGIVFPRTVQKHKIYRKSQSSQLSELSIENPVLNELMYKCGHRSAL